MVSSIMIIVEKVERSEISVNHTKEYMGYFCDTRVRYRYNNNIHYLKSKLYYLHFHEMRSIAFDVKYLIITIPLSPHY